MKTKDKELKRVFGEKYKTGQLIITKRPKKQKDIKNKGS